MTALQLLWGSEFTNPGAANKLAQRLHREHLAVRCEEELLQ